MKLEMFIDPAYYDMWCVKPIDMKDFGATLHFNTEKEAGYAKQVIEKWMTESSKREWVGLTDEDKQEAFDETQEASGGFWEFADYLEARLKEKNT